AAIANMMWNWRMLAATGESRFMDVIERALYNGINSGMSLDGTLYCYRNPLESSGEKIRNPWYDTTCCPPNLQRIFASLPGYLYSTSAEGLYVQMFHNSSLDWRLENGTPIKVTQESKYPWEGDVTITVSPAAASDFTLFVRIPAWADGANVAVNGKPAPGVAKQGEYFAIKRNWKAGDKVELSLPMTPHLILANERVRENVGRVAVERGPLVYCLEQHDYPGRESIFNAILPVGTTPARGFRSEFLPDKLGGIVVLKHRGIAKSKPLTDEPLYRTLETANRSVNGRAVELTFIPYYAWANREPDSMQVWIPYTQAPGAGQ
ncbi:MAG: glycoside hydrolase family 127 protein, partial [Acidobacteria bacterium]|nr:glycoside hydrolase family 127 protein [Acidobacteriota bacterium]